MLTVWDNVGDISSVTKNVVVSDPGNPPSIQLWYPLDNGIVKGNNVTVNWYAHDPEDLNNLSIYLYVSNDNGVTRSAFKGNPFSNTGTYNWDTTALPDGTYKLFVEAVDSQGNVARDSSSFQINHLGLSNAPNPPKITGPSSGEIGKSTNYVLTTTDPEGYQVFYYINWGDGQNSGWIGPYASGSPVTQSHTWSTKGNFAITAQAKDTADHISDWGSLPVSVSLPSFFHQFIEKLFERYPNAFPQLRHLLG
jgi:hypothetical protein